MRRTLLRAAGPDALRRRVAAIESAGLGEGSTDQVAGQGPTYLFHDPDGHRMGIYWARDWYRPAAGDAPALKNHAARFPGRGANVRRLDHVNYLSSHVLEDCAFYEDALGARRTEQIVDDADVPQAIWFSVTDKTYDLVANIDHTGSSGRLHHIAFATDTREDILRAADVCLEAGIHIETGPHKHAIQWNEGKAEANRRKHGVDFLEAMEVLLDPLAVTVEDRHHTTPAERRVSVVGMSRRERLIRVTVVQRSTIIRVISARRATARERHDYEAG